MLSKPADATGRRRRSAAGADSWVEAESIIDEVSAVLDSQDAYFDAGHGGTDLDGDGQSEGDDEGEVV
jgi:hypothetical protein